jgi:Cu+-exporting ATPase
MYIKYRGQYEAQEIVMQPKKQKDPVCGMNINPSECPYKTEHKNKQYSFCCKECMTAFKNNPDKFSKA